MKNSDYLLSLSCMTFSSTKTKLKSMLNAASLKAITVMHFLCTHMEDTINKNARTEVFLYTMSSGREGSTLKQISALLLRT